MLRLEAKYMTEYVIFYVWKIIGHSLSSACIIHIDLVLGYGLVVPG